MSVSVFRKMRWDADERLTVPCEDVEEVEEQGVFHVAHVLCSRLLEGRAVDDPPLAYEGVSLWWERAEGKLTNGNSTKSLRP